MLYCFRRLVGLLLALPIAALAGQPSAPVITNLTVNGSQKSLRFEPFPGAESYAILSATNPAGLFAADTNFAYVPYLVSASTNGTNYSYEWRTTNSRPSEFFRVRVGTQSPDALLTSIVLSRLAYGPSPDELERVRAMGPQAYIDEQLNMDGVPETLDTYVSEVTNSIPSDPATNWAFIAITGKMTTTNLYLFLTQPGEVLIDNVQLVEGTNAGMGVNLISNGDFESGLTSWSVTGGAAGSAIVTTNAQSGGSCLRLSSTTAGSTSGNNIWQWFPTALTNTTTLTLSYWYLPTPTSSRLRVQLGGAA